MSGWCDESGNNYDDWIEIYNNGTTPIDLSRWRIDTDNMRHFHHRTWQQLIR